MSESDDPRKWARDARDRPLWVRIGVAIAVALVFGISLGLRDSVSHDGWGLKIALAIAGIVGIAMVAPGLFTGKNRDPNDWSDEIKRIENQSKGEPSGESEKVADRDQ